MTALVVYDSGYGNTAEIAREIASAFPGGAEASLVDSIDPERLPPSDFLVVGSPTQGGRPTPAVQAWLDRLPADALENRRCVAFDTRLSYEEQNGALRLLMRIIGFAAPRIAKKLVAKRGILAMEPEGFIVEGREGPLREGERERAKSWVKMLAAT